VYIYIYIYIYICVCVCVCVCAVYVSGEFGLEINICKTKVMVAAQKKTTYYSAVNN